MRSPILLALLSLGGCGNPETELVDVRIPVSLVDPLGDLGRCFEGDYADTRSVLVELQQPLGDIGRCLHKRQCVEVEPQSLRSRDELQEVLRAHGPYFADLPPFDEVLLHVRGVPRPDCDVLAVEDPLYCGFSNIASIADESAHFTVAVSCALDRSLCPLAPPCAGADP